MRSSGVQPQNGAQAWPGFFWSWTHARPSPSGRHPAIWIESPRANETHSARLVSSRRPSPTNAVRSRTLPSPLTASACPSKIPTIPFQRPLGCETLRRRRRSLLASQRSKLACTSSRSSLLGPPRSSPPNVSLCNWNLAPSSPQSYRRKRVVYLTGTRCLALHTHFQVRNQGIFTIPPVRPRARRPPQRHCRQGV